jgi:hypothetical protein
MAIVTTQQSQRARVEEYKPGTRQDTDPSKDYDTTRVHGQFMYRASQTCVEGDDYYDFTGQGQVFHHPGRVCELPHD